MTKRTISAKPFASLRRHGLRVTRHLDIRAKYVDVHFEVPAQLNSAPMLIYKSVSIGAYTYCRSGIIKHVKSIGRYCSLGPNVTLGEGEHPTGWLSTSLVSYNPAMYAWYPPELEDAPKRMRPRTVDTDQSMEHGQVTIGNDVWIGTNAMIRRGVHIGDGAVIGAGAYVNRDVEPYSVVAGVPARVIRMRFDDATIEALMALRWWEFHANDMIGVPFESPQDAIPMIEDMEAAGTLSRWPVTFRTARLTRQGYTRIRGIPKKPKPDTEEPQVADPSDAVAAAAVAAVALQDTLDPPVETWQAAPSDETVMEQVEAGVPEGVEEMPEPTTTYFPGVRFGNADAATADNDAAPPAHAAPLADAAPPADAAPLADADAVVQPTDADFIEDALLAALAEESIVVDEVPGAVDVAEGPAPLPGDWRAAEGWAIRADAGRRLETDAGLANGTRATSFREDAPAEVEPETATDDVPMTEAVLAAFALDGLEEELAAHRREIDGDANSADEDPSLPGDAAAEPQPDAAADPDPVRVIFPWNR